MLAAYLLSAAVLGLVASTLYVLIPYWKNKSTLQRPSSITGLVAKRTLENYQLELRGGQAKAPSVAQKRGAMLGHLRSIYKKRQEFDKKRRFITLFQSLATGAVVLKLLDIKIPLRFAYISLNPHDLEPKSETFLLVFAALLAPLVAKASFMEFYFARLFYQLLREYNLGPQALVGAIHMTSGHQILWKAADAARRSQILNPFTWIIANFGVLSICIYDYIVEFFPFAASALILMRGDHKAIPELIEGLNSTNEFALYTVCFFMIFVIYARFVPLKS